MNTIEMAREAGIKSGDIYKLTVGHMSIKTLEQFAALVRADEREACAKLCEENMFFGTGEHHAAAIRARGTT
jgi:hypothetical protein